MTTTEPVQEKKPKPFELSIEPPKKLSATTFDEGWQRLDPTTFPWTPLRPQGQKLLDELEKETMRAEQDIRAGKPLDVASLQERHAAWKDWETRFDAVQDEYYRENTFLKRMESGSAFMGVLGRTTLAAFLQSGVDFLVGAGKPLRQGLLGLEHEMAGKEGPAPVLEPTLPEKGVEALRGAETTEQAMAEAGIKERGSKLAIQTANSIASVLGFLLGPLKITKPVAALAPTRFGSTVEAITGTAAQFATESYVRTGNGPEAMKAAALTPIYVLIGKAGAALGKSFVSMKLPPALAGGVAGAIEGLGFAAMDIDSLKEGAKAVIDLHRAWHNKDEAGAAKALERLDPVLANIMGSMAGIGLLKGMEFRRRAPQIAMDIRLKQMEKTEPERQAFEKEAMAGLEADIAEAKAQPAKPETPTKLQGPGTNELLDMAGFTVNEKGTFKRPGFPDIKPNDVNAAEAVDKATMAALEGRQLLRHQGIEETMTPGVFWSMSHQGPVAIDKNGNFVAGEKGTLAVRPPIHPYRKDSVALLPREVDAMEAWRRAILANRFTDPQTIAIWGSLERWMNQAPLVDTHLVRHIGNVLANPAMFQQAVRDPGMLVRNLARNVVAGDPIGPRALEGAPPAKEGVITEGVKRVEPQPALAPTEAPAATKPAATTTPKEPGAAAKAVGGLGAGFWEQLHDRLGRIGGEAGRAFAETSRNILSRKREIQGKLAVEGGVDTAQKIVSKPGGFSSWLAKGVDVAPGVRVTRWRLTEPGLESMLGEVPEAYRGKLKTVTEANLAGGEVGGVARGEVQRFPTPRLMDMIQQGGAGHTRLIDAYAKLNPEVPREKIADMFKTMKGDIDAGGTPDIRKIGQEFHRLFKVVPSQIKLPWRGWVDLYYDRPADYFRHMLERVPGRIAFREAVPDEALDPLLKKIRAEGPETGTAVDELVRAHHGMVQPTTGALDRFATGVANFPLFRDVYRPLALSASAIANLVEQATGLTQRSLGFRTFAKAAVKAFGPGGKAYRKSLELHGDINKAVYDWTLDPQHPVRTALKYFRNSASVLSGNRFLNELTETLSAASAEVFTQRLQKGEFSAWGRVRFTRSLMDFGFSEQQAAQMVAGKAEPALYDRFRRGAAAVLSGGNKAMPEMSRFQGNRALTGLFPFMDYPIIQAQKIVPVIGQAMDSTNSPAIRARAALDVAKQLGWSTAGSGVAIGLIRAQLHGGDVGTSVFFKDAEEETGRFILDAALSGIGGPLATVGAFWERGKDEGYWGEAAMQSMLPFSATANLASMFAAKGRYEGMSLGERAGEYLLRFPAGRILSSQLGATAFGQMPKEDRAAIRALRDWERDRELPQGMSKGGTDQDKEFRAAMREGLRLIAADKNPDEAWMKVLELAETDERGRHPFDRIRSSLQGHRYLAEHEGVPGRLDDLRQRIGEPAYERLERLDAILDAWAKSFQRTR